MVNYEDFGREPTIEELEAIEEEFKDCLLKYPFSTDSEKSVDDWANLIIEYALKAVAEGDTNKRHLRFVQAGNLAARAAIAVRTGATNEQ